jgi:small subunit ribosomal protein S17
MTERGMRKIRVGKVVSNKMDKTVIVRVETTTRHPLYAKTMRRQRKLYAHDEANDCRIGDVVRIAETRPMSKLKRWRVVDVVEKARE